MAKDISYASGDSELETLVLHTLPDFGEHGDGIINANLLTAVLKEKGRFIVSEGGLEFWFGLMTSENSNAGWQGKADDYRVGLQNPEVRLRWDIKVFTDTIAITELDEARNKGRAAIKDFARTLRMQAESTIPNRFNSAFWATSPGANDPDSIPSIVSATPTTGSIGGLSRATATQLQNKTYTTAVASLGSAAGFLVLQAEQLKAMVTANDMPDLAVCSVSKYAGVASYLGTLYRYRPDDVLAKLNIEHVQVMGLTVAPEMALANVKNGENGITEGYCYLLNTKHLFFKLLADGNFKWGDKFERAALKPVKFLPFKVFCNLCTNLPAAHSLLTSVTA
jgi:hypothetical protein